MHCPNLRTDCTHGNPAVGARARKLEHRLHVERLKAVVASVDNTKPFMGNTEQQQKRPRKSYQQRSKEKMQAHENFKMLTTIAATMNRPCRRPPQPVASRSLNIALRRREHRKIVKENQKLLERLEKSKPLVATAAQYRQDFVEHERRLMLCSYSCRRKKVDNLRSLKPDQKAEEQHRIENDARRRQCAEQELRHKLAIKCYKCIEAPHISTSDAEHRAARSPTTPEPVTKQFNQRWREFKCYPASRQMWAPPRVFVPSDLPKPFSPPL